MRAVDGLAAELPIPFQVVGAKERLVRLGAAALSDAELLCVVVGRKLETSALAPGLRAIAQEEPSVLQSALGDAAPSILAAIELGRRLQSSNERRPRLKTPKDIYLYLSPLLAAQRREQFHVLCLNSRNVLLRDVKIAEGTVNACPVDPREVFAPALETRATAIVLAHNHPSGDPEPSTADVALTQRLIEGGRVLGIGILDHVVFGDGGYVSMLERDLLPRSAA
jgi:DNA repair protein RadC